MGASVCSFKVKVYKVEWDSIWIQGSLLNKTKEGQAMNGEHGKIYGKIDSVFFSLEEKIDAIKEETSDIKTDVAVIKNSFKSLPCPKNTKKIDDLQLKVYMGVGGVGVISLLALTKTIGLWWLEELKMSFELQEYEWEKTAWKGFQIFVMGGIGAGISYLGGLPSTETIIITVALLKMVQNYLKHA